MGASSSGRSSRRPCSTSRWSSCYSVLGEPSGPDHDAGDGHDHGDSDGAARDGKDAPPGPGCCCVWSLVVRHRLPRPERTSARGPRRVAFDSPGSPADRRPIRDVRSRLPARFHPFRLGFSHREVGDGVYDEPTDDFGIPRNTFGYVEERFWGALGRIASPGAQQMVAALWRVARARYVRLPPRSTSSCRRDGPPGGATPAAR
jgi:hypothetical protein